MVCDGNIATESSLSCDSLDSFYCSKACWRDLSFFSYLNLCCKASSFLLSAIVSLTALSWAVVMKIYIDLTESLFSRWFVVLIPDIIVSSLRVYLSIDFFKSCMFETAYFCVCKGETWEVEIV